MEKIYALNWDMKIWRERTVIYLQGWYNKGSAVKNAGVHSWKSQHIKEQQLKIFAIRIKLPTSLTDVDSASFQRKQRQFKSGQPFVKFLLLKICLY
jgi:hypothetical protein